ncbi:MAG TPA: metallophosphoesterase [Acidimicrobiales bacterium]|nr:metallophosphoesterase [Acidimicrobiales bacterium]
MTDPSPRPESDQPDQVGFTPQSMVRWLSPTELARAAVRVGLSAIFGAYSDKREIQAALRECVCFDYSDRSELWVDFVADLGDGFDSTYTVASLLAAEKLDLGPSSGATTPTPRGKVLIMGGDQVYPTASREAYEDRMQGPYRAALPYTRDDHPNLFAIPGNHDWYDGLTSFIRVFCQQHWLGGWCTRQTRSYFALQLPHRWWLLGIDMQFDAYIDDPQLRFFTEEVRPNLRPGDAVILCTGQPNWVAANVKDPEAFRNLDYFERKVIPEGVQLRVSLSGDTHHYAHYASEDGTRHAFTAGGGGAYLAATHRLPTRLEVPPRHSKDPGRSSPRQYGLVSTFPDRARSRRLRWGVVRLPLLNPGFWALLGAVHVLYGWMVHGAVRVPGQPFDAVMAGLSFNETLAGVGRSPLALLLSVLVAAGLAGFTKATRPAKRWLVGLTHAAAHLLLVVAVLRASSALLGPVHGEAFVVAFVAVVAVAGGLLASLLMAGYLIVADALGCNTNELFAAQRIEDWKNFLRLHVDESGTLTIYPVGVERAGRGWKFRRDAGGEGAWFHADPPPKAALIEAPVVVGTAGSCPA